LKRFALLGEPLGHSLSPALHKAIYRQLEIDDASYRTVEMPEERLRSFFTGFKVGGFDGVNVTVPHKAAVIPLLDEVDSKAKLIDAVNCINRDGNKLTGYNTDMLGFAYSLRQHDIEVNGGSFLIIGAGGTAQAMAAVLAEGEAKSISILNRTAEKAELIQATVSSINDQVKVDVIDAEKLLTRAATMNCVINATSVGMSPDTRSSPISDELAAKLFSDKNIAFDAIYNPIQTQFLKSAEQQGAITINGLQMLVAQAVYSLEIWMGGNIVAHVDMNALVRDLEKNIK